MEVGMGGGRWESDWEREGVTTSESVGVWGACHHVCTCADAGEEGQSEICKLQMQYIIKLGYSVLL